MTNRTGGIGDSQHPSRFARLARHKLVFQRLATGEPAFANIRASDEEVLGAIYYCSSEALERLDSFEEGYERRTVHVTDSNGESIAAVAYFMCDDGKEIVGRPSDEYLVRIIQGAKQHGLPESYISAIISQAQSGSEEG